MVLLITMMNIQISAMDVKSWILLENFKCLWYMDYKHDLESKFLFMNRICGFSETYILNSWKYLSPDTQVELEHMSTCLQRIYYCPSNKSSLSRILCHFIPVGWRTKKGKVLGLHWVSSTACFDYVFSPKVV